MVVAMVVAVIISGRLWSEGDDTFSAAVVLIIVMIVVAEAVENCTI